VAHLPPARPLPPYRLLRTALWLAIALGIIAILRLLPAGAFVFLVLALVAALAILTANPLVTLAVGTAVAAFLIRRR
jgi:hypothetical protein